MKNSADQRTNRENEKENTQMNQPFCGCLNLTKNVLIHSSKAIRDYAIYYNSIPKIVEANIHEFFNINERKKRFVDRRERKRVRESKRKGKRNPKTYTPIIL